jgi:hypothetical protein
MGGAAAVSIVAGGVLGTAMDYLVSMPAAMKEQHSAAEKA